MKRFEDYKQDVILAYEKKKKEGELPPNLQRPTAANLRKECLDVFHNRYLDKDNPTFKSIFEERNNAEEYLKRIRATKSDKFKPLDNFLKGNTDQPKERYIELLAWLIDFEPRPHQYADMFELVKNERNSPATIDDHTTVADGDSKVESKDQEQKEIESPPKPFEDEGGDQAAPETSPTETYCPTIINEDLGVPRKFNKTIIAFFAALVILSGTYIFYDNTKHQCMYWDVDHYKAVTCDQKVDGSSIIALDTFSLHNLRKITNLKLITPNAIGKVHYSKVDGKVEFYTSGGENPTDNRKRLLPMTEFIYKKYVLKSIR